MRRDRRGSAEPADRRGAPRSRRARLDAAGRLRASSCAGACAQGRDSRNVPIIMLTARGEETDRIRGLRPAPTTTSSSRFRCRELMARVKALLRRTAPDRVAEVLNARRHRARPRRAPRHARRREIRLGPTEFRLLEFLMESSGPRLSRDAAARRRVGPRRLRRRAHRRRPYRPPAQVADPRRRARSDPHRALGRLRVRRNLTQSTRMIKNAPDVRPARWLSCASAAIVRFSGFFARNR